MGCTCKLFSFSPQNTNAEHYKQCGSDCTELTATGLVNGEGEILTPYTESKPLKRSI